MAPPVAPETDEDEDEVVPDISPTAEREIARAYKRTLRRIKEHVQDVANPSPDEIQEILADVGYIPTSYVKIAKQYKIRLPEMYDKTSSLYYKHNSEHPFDMFYKLKYCREISSGKDAAPPQHNVRPVKMEPPVEILQVLHPLAAFQGFPILRAFARNPDLSETAVFLLKEAFKAQAQHEHQQRIAAAASINPMYRSELNQSPSHADYIAAARHLSGTATQQLIDAIALASHAVAADTAGQRRRATVKEEQPDEDDDDVQILPRKSPHRRRRSTRAPGQIPHQLLRPPTIPISDSEETARVVHVKEEVDSNSQPDAELNNATTGAIPATNPRMKISPSSSSGSDASDDIRAANVLMNLISTKSIGAGRVRSPPRHFFPPSVKIANNPLFAAGMAMISESLLQQESQAIDQKPDLPSRNSNDEEEADDEDDDSLPSAAPPVRSAPVVPDGQTGITGEENAPEDSYWDEAEQKYFPLRRYRTYEDDRQLLIEEVTKIKAIQRAEYEKIHGPPPSAEDMEVWRASFPSDHISDKPVNLFCPGELTVTKKRTPTVDTRQSPRDSSTSPQKSGLAPPLRISRASMSPFASPEKTATQVPSTVSPVPAPPKGYVINHSMVMGRWPPSALYVKRPKPKPSPEPLELQPPPQRRPRSPIPSTSPPRFEIRIRESSVFQPMQDVPSSRYTAPREPAKQQLPKESATASNKSSANVEKAVSASIRTTIDLKRTPAVTAGATDDKEKRTTTSTAYQATTRVFAIPKERIEKGEATVVCAPKSAPFVQQRVSASATLKKQPDPSSRAREASSVPGKQTPTENKTSNEQAKANKPSSWRLHRRRVHRGLNTRRRASFPKLDSTDSSNLRKAIVNMISSPGMESNREKQMLIEALTKPHAFSTFLKANSTTAERLKQFHSIAAEARKHKELRRLLLKQPVSSFKEKLRLLQKRKRYGKLLHVPTKPVSKKPLTPGREKANTNANTLRQKTTPPSGDPSSPSSSSSSGFIPSPDTSNDGSDDIPLDRQVPDANELRKLLGPSIPKKLFVPRRPTPPASPPAQAPPPSVQPSPLKVFLPDGNNIQLDVNSMDQNMTVGECLKQLLLPTGENKQPLRKFLRPKPNLLELAREEELRVQKRGGELRTLPPNAYFYAICDRFPPVLRNAFEYYLKNLPQKHFHSTMTLRDLWAKMNQVDFLDVDIMKKSLLPIKEDTPLAEKKRQLQQYYRINSTYGREQQPDQQRDYTLRIPISFTEPPSQPHATVFEITRHTPSGAVQTQQVTPTEYRQMMALDDPLPVSKPMKPNSDNIFGFTVEMKKHWFVGGRIPKVRGNKKAVLQFAGKGEILANVPPSMHYEERLLPPGEGEDYQASRAASFHDMVTMQRMWKRARSMVPCLEIRETVKTESANLHISPMKRKQQQGCSKDDPIARLQLPDKCYFGTGAYAVGFLNHSNKVDKARFHDTVQERLEMTVDKLAVCVEYQRRKTLEEQAKKAPKPEEIVLDDEEERAAKERALPYGRHKSVLTVQRRLKRKLKEKPDITEGIAEAKKKIEKQITSKSARELRGKQKKKTTTMESTSSTLPLNLVEDEELEKNKKPSRDRSVDRLTRLLNSTMSDELLDTSEQALRPLEPMLSPRRPKYPIPYKSPSSYPMLISPVPATQRTPEKHPTTTETVAKAKEKEAWDHMSKGRSLIESPFAQRQERADTPERQPVFKPLSPLYVDTPGEGGSGSETSPELGGGFFAPPLFHLSPRRSSSGTPETPTRTPARSPLGARMPREGEPRVTRSKGRQSIIAASARDPNTPKKRVAFAEQPTIYTIEAVGAQRSLRSVKDALKDPKSKNASQFALASSTVSKATPSTASRIPPGMIYPDTPIPPSKRPKAKRNQKGKKATSTEDESADEVKQEADDAADVSSGADVIDIITISSTPVISPIDVEVKIEMVDDAMDEQHQQDTVGATSGGQPQTTRIATSPKGTKQSANQDPSSAASSSALSNAQTNNSTDNSRTGLYENGRSNSGRGGKRGRTETTGRSSSSSSSSGDSARNGGKEDMASPEEEQRSSDDDIDSSFEKRKKMTKKPPRKRIVPSGPSSDSDPPPKKSRKRIASSSDEEHVANNNIVETKALQKKTNSTKKRALKATTTIIIEDVLRDKLNKKENMATTRKSARDRTRAAAQGKQPPPTKGTAKPNGKKKRNMQTTSSDGSQSDSDAGSPLPGPSGVPHLNNNTAVFDAGVLKMLRFGADLRDETMADMAGGSSDGYDSSDERRSAGPEHEPRRRYGLNLPARSASPTTRPTPSWKARHQPHSYSEAPSDAPSAEFELGPPTGSDLTGSYVTRQFTYDSAEPIPEEIKLTDAERERVRRATWILRADPGRDREPPSLNDYEADMERMQRERLRMNPVDQDGVEYIGGQAIPLVLNDDEDRFTGCQTFVRHFDMVMLNDDGDEVDATGTVTKRLRTPTPPPIPIKIEEADEFEDSKEGIVGVPSKYYKPTFIYRDTEEFGDDLQIGEATKVEPDAEQTPAEPANTGREVLAAPSSERLFYSQVFGRFYEEIGETQRYQQKFADIIMNRLGGTAQELFEDHEFPEFAFAPPEFVKVFEITEDQFMRKMFEKHKLKDNEALLEFIFTPEFDETNRKRLSAAILLRETITVAKVSEMHSKLIQYSRRQMHNTIRKACGFSDPKRLEYEGHVEDLMKKLSFTIVRSFVTLARASAKMATLDIYRVLSLLYMGWMGWFEAGGAYQLFQTEERFPPKAMELAKKLKDESERRCKANYPKHARSPMQMVKSALTELELHARFRDLVKNAGKRATATHPVECEYKVDKGKKCPLTFANREDLAVHTLLCHERRPLPCLYCGRRYLLPSSRTAHVNLYHHDETNMDSSGEDSSSD